MNARRFFAAGSLAAMAAVPTLAAPLRLEPHWRLSVEVLVAGPELPGSVARPDVEVSRSAPARVEVVVPWPGAPASGRLSVELALHADGEEEAEIDIDTDLRLPGRAPVTAARRIAVNESSAQLFEAFSEGDARLVLAIQGQRSLRPVVDPPVVAVADAVRFYIGVERIDADRSVPLETNVLQTFVGEPVAYSFRRGEGDSEEELRLELTPVRQVGELVEIRVALVGRLPGPDGPRTTTQRESLLTSRGATSFVTLTSGPPPVGYRFAVTPDF